MNKESFAIFWSEDEPLSVTRRWDGLRVLNRDLTIKINDKVFVVKEGFETDLSSYPFFSRVLVRFDRVDVAGVVHDWIYYHGLTSRKEADLIWRQVAMAGDNGANSFQAWVSWLGLRIFGGFAWKEHENRRNE